MNIVRNFITIRYFQQNALQSYHIQGWFLCMLWVLDASGDRWTITIVYITEKNIRD